MAEKGDFNVKDEVEGEKGEPDSKNRPGSVVEGIDDDLKNKSDAKSNGKVKDDNEEEEEEAEKPAIVFL